MVRSLLTVLMIAASIQASVYKSNCVRCHEELPVSIDKYFYRYLLKYSGETAVRKAMKDYLNNPSREKTIMPDAFVNRFGIKKKTELGDADLDDALNEYWQTYKVFGKLK